MTTNQTKFYNQLRADLNSTNVSMLELSRKKAQINEKASRGVFTRSYADEEIAKLDKQLEKLRYDGEVSANAIIDHRIQSLDAETALDPAKLTEDAKLLELDGLLTQLDIDAMMLRSRSNPTMTRLVMRFADRNGLRTETPSYMIEGHENARAAEGMRESVRAFMKWAGDPDRAEGMLERLFPPLV